MILIIDDDELTRSALCDVLTAVGHVATGYSGGEEALRFLRDHPDTELALLDLMMPDMSGYEFRRRQLADPSIAGVPVLVFTAQAGALEELAADTPVLRKPAGLAALLAAIAAATTAAR